MKKNPMHPHKAPTGNNAWTMATAKPHPTSLLSEAREVIEEGAFVARQGINTAVKLAVSAAKIATTVAAEEVGSSRVDLQACKLEYSIVSPK